MPNKPLILGAIIGDVIGSVYEWNNIKTTDFPLFSPNCKFTDDSVLTFATMDAILNQSGYAKAYHSYGRNFPNRGYGGHFQKWLISSNLLPYYSWGNGSAMRVSPIGWAYDTIEEVLEKAEESAVVTHNHQEGIKGAQATATAIFLARTGSGKAEIKSYIEQTFNYNLNRTIDEIRPTFKFDESCQGTVPESIIAFLESTDFESAIRLAISLGGDSDTLACITGGIAEAYYKNVPEYIIKHTLELIPKSIVKLIEEFSNKYNNDGI